MKRYIVLIVLILLLLASTVSSADDKNIRLDDIVVEERRTDDRTGNQITQEDMERKNSKDLWDAVKNIPGITLSSGGGRNDSSFKLRGFETDGVPILIDGISLSSPFSGRGDYARILTGDLESVTILKGYSSLLYGPNMLGGAVLMQTAKPKKSLEAKVKAGVDLDNIFNYSASSYLASLGTKQDKFYLSGVFQYREIDHFRLSKSYNQNDSGNPQKSGDRLYSDSIDMKTTILAGVTPIDGLDISLNYVYYYSDKGVSPFETSSKYSILEWDDWQRHTISLKGAYKFYSFKIEALAYFDKNDNTMKEYSTLKHLESKRPNTTTTYDEYTAGTRLTLTYDINKINQLRSAVSYKKENHEGIRNEKADIYVEEDIWSAGVEYDYKPIEKLTLSAGIGFDSLLPQSYWGKDNEFAKLMGIASYQIKTKNRWLLTAQAGVFWEFIKHQTARLTYARKNHFPSMSQRYSTRFSESIPNPKLKPEMADHFEIGYKGLIANMLTINSSVYYSVISDKIVTIDIPDPISSYTSALYSVNLDKISFYGFEFTGELFLNQYFSFGSTFALNMFAVDKSALKMKAVPYYPMITSSGYITVTPLEWIAIEPRVEYVSKRYSDLDGLYSLDGYLLAHIKVSFDIFDYVLISAFVNNISDENYEILKGFPMAGRSYGVNATVKY